MNRLTTGVLIYFLFIFPLSAHGDLVARIQQVTKEIKLEPNNEYLYYKRGVLFFQHEEYKNSIKDLKKAKAKGYDDILLDFYLAKDYHRIKKFRKAKKTFVNILEQKPKNVNMLKAFARLQFDMKAYEASATSLKKVIQYSLQAFPEHYIEAAKAYAAIGSEKANSQAIGMMEDGIQKLGPAVVLYEELKRLALGMNHLEVAISAQKEIIKRLNRKELAYFHLAELYLQEPDLVLHKHYLLASKTALQKLPTRIQETIAMVSLDHKIRDYLLDLKE